MASNRSIRGLHNEMLPADEADRGDSQDRGKGRSSAEKEVFLRTILKTLPDLIWLKDPAGAYLACNTMFEKFIGAKESEIVGKNDYDFLGPDEATFFREQDRRAMAAGKPTMNEETVTFAADGHRAVLETIKTPMHDETGALVGVLGISRDITERKQMEEALSSSAKIHGVLREIAEAALLSLSLEELFPKLHGLIVKILPAKLFHVNFLDDNAKEVRMPFRTDELNFIPHSRPIGNGLTEYVMRQGQTVYLRPADLDRLRDTMEYFLPEMPAAPIRHYLASPLFDSSNKPFGTMALMLMGDNRQFHPEDGKILSIIAAQVSMVIRSKQAEEAMRESERRFSNAFTYAPIGMALISITGHCLKVNQSLCRLLGYSSEELLAMRIMDRMHPDDFAVSEEQRRDLMSGKIAFYQAERQYYGKSGQLVWTLVSSSLVRSEQGKPLYVVAQIENISDRKRMEQELRIHAGKLEEMVARRTEELFAANQELTAMNEELTSMNERMGAINAMLEESNQQLKKEIASRLKKESEILLRVRQYQAASTLLISSAAQAKDQMREAIMDALRLVKAQIGYIGLYNVNTHNFDICCAIGPPDTLVQGARPADKGLLGEMFQSGEVVYVPDYRLYPKRQIDAALDRLSSIVTIPMKRGDRITGGLTVAWLDEVHALGEEEIEVLRQYGNLVTVALERNETQMRMERKNRLLQGLAETTAVLMGELELDAVLQIILDKAMDLADIPHGFVLLVDEKDPHQVSFRAGHGRYRARVGECETWQDGVYEEMLRTDRMAVVEDYVNWPLRNQEAVQDGVTMSVQSPLKVDGRIIGAIGLTACGETIVMNSEKTAVLEQFAHIASIAVKNALYHEKIRKLAYHDTLTGLPNRAGLAAYLENELAKARMGKAAGAVMFIDLDDLKTVNDHFGHTSGDSVIVSAGADIVGAAGNGAFVARVGGDEFVVVLPDADRPEIVVQIAERLVGAIRREYAVRGEQIHMSTSLGVTRYPEDGDLAEEILKNADIAMYAAKAAGKNCWRLYEQGMMRDTYEKMMLTNSLRHALENGELYLEYQPLLSLKKRSVEGFEALLRWNSREYGAVAPTRFIALAEQSGLIFPIGEWVIGEACRFARKLSDMGRAHVQVAVNVSPRQLAAEDFVGIVCRCIDKAGIRPQQLEVEITENVLIESMEDSTRKLAELSALGVQLALDDFGTGFSSLTYLRNLPVKTLKIDKSFTDRMLEDKVQEGFIRSIVDMAHVLSLNVVAEGVETEPQLSKLAQFGCDCVQGYVFSRPVSQENAIQFVT